MLYQSLNAKFCDEIFAVWTDFGPTRRKQIGTERYRSGRRKRLKAGVGSVTIDLRVTDERSQSCRVGLGWKGDRAALDQLIAEMDRTAYSRNIAPDHLAISTALRLPTLRQHRGIEQFKTLLWYWAFSLPTGDPERPGSYFDHVTEGVYRIEIGVLERQITSTWTRPGVSVVRIFETARRGLEGRLWRNGAACAFDGSARSGGDPSRHRVVGPRPTLGACQALDRQRGGEAAERGFRLLSG